MRFRTVLFEYISVNDEVGVEGTNEETDSGVMNWFQNF